MDGEFIRKKYGVPGVLLLGGIILIALYIYFCITEPESGGQGLSLLLVGVLICSVVISSMLLNHGAFIHIGDAGIEAKYHWFGRLDCRVDEVAFVLPQINALTILLNSGKRHVIMGIENPWALSAALRRRLFEVEKETPDTIRQRLKYEQTAHKKSFWWLVGGIALMFSNIFIAMLLTGGREMHEFNKLDWVFFTAMGIAELATVIALFYVAKRCGAHLLPIEQLKYRLRGAIIATDPLPTNNVIAVYTDENYTGRVCVCGFPNDKSVYYCVQEIVGDFRFETVHTSKVYDNTDELPKDDLSVLIDITYHFTPKNRTQC